MDYIESQVDYLSLRMDYLSLLLAATLFDQPLAELNDQEFGATEKRPRRAS